MSQQFDHVQPMPDGRTVGFSLHPHKGFWRVQFRGPDKKYRRSLTRIAETAPQQYAVREAAKIIAEAFSKAAQKAKGPKPTWAEWDDELYRKLMLNNNRKGTYDAYAKNMRLVRDMLPATKGPADVTSELAETFKDVYLSTPFKRSNKPNAKGYPRTAGAFNSALRNIRAIWGHLRPRPEVNPWERIEKAETDKKSPKCPKEDTVIAFLAWIDKRFGAWKLPLAFFSVKMNTGCRLKDLCQLPAKCFADGSVEFPAAVTKNRADRSFVLTAEVADMLTEVKGDDMLWDRYPKGLRKHAETTKYAVGLIHDHYRWSAMYSFAGRMMKTFGKQTGLQFTTHDFRRRAVNRLYDAGHSINDIADILGMTPQNVANYLDRTRRIGAYKFVKASAILMPSKTA